MLAAAKERTPVVGVRAACAALGLPRSSFYQAQQPARPPAPTQPRPCSHRSLTSEEQQTIRDLLNSERFIDQAPRTIYATLLDEGQYFCSWRTMYRLLKQDDATRERRNQRRRPAYQAPELLATGPATARRARRQPRCRRPTGRPRLGERGHGRAAPAAQRQQHAGL